MLEHLFGSKTRIKLLRLFYRHPKKSFFVRELTRLLDVQINAIRREIDLLLKSGLVKEVDAPDRKDMGKAGSSLRKYYQLDTDSILCSEMQSLLLKAQVLGEQKMVADIQKKAGDLSLFLLTGQFTGDLRAESDMLLVGKIKSRALDALISAYEKEFGFAIRYTLMTESEFQDRRHVMDKFLYSLFDAKHVTVVDTYKV